MQTVDFSFKRRYRLKRPSEFRKVLKAGHKRRGRFFSVYLNRTTDGECKFAVIVGRRVGGAVQRNRVKRLLREAFRHIRKDVLPGTRIIVRAEPGIAKATYSELFEELRRLLGIEITG